MIGTKFGGKWVVVGQAPPRKEGGLSLLWECQCEKCEHSIVVTTEGVNQGRNRICKCPEPIKLRVDYTGTRIKTFTVTGISHRQGIKLFYKAVCDCGFERVVRADSIPISKIAICKCQTPAVKERKDPFVQYKDLVGQRFGKLVVTLLKRVGERVVARAECDCGGVNEVSPCNLITGRTKSCGCYKTENLIGKKFGKLTVLWRGESRNHRTTWMCACDCGNVKEIRAAGMKSGQINSCGCVSTEALCAYNREHRGPKSPNYNTELPDELRLKHRNTNEYRDWRLKVYRLNNFKCSLCGYKKRLNAHHILPYIAYPQLRYVVANGITLCSACHKELHSAVGLWRYNFLDHHNYIEEAFKQRSHPK